MSALTVAARPSLSPLRIGAIATALAVHLVAFGVLVLPPSLILSAAQQAPAAIDVVFVTPEIPPPPIPVPPVPPPPLRPTPRAPAPGEQPRVVVESDNRIAAPQPAPLIETAGEPTTEPAPAPAAAATIAYDDVTPPPYPRSARHQNLQGEVLLRVQVDATGKPIAVDIEHSSGHRILDRSAREHVLKHWRFQPALLDGRPVAAWALVPVSFRLEAG